MHAHLTPNGALPVEAKPMRFSKPAAQKLTLKRYTPLKEHGIMGIGRLRL
ncbi:MAG: hypothetical protein GDYSWBUE_000398 [Candidatus Fervidibacterota bacterium]